MTRVVALAVVLAGLAAGLAACTHPHEPEPPHTQPMPTVQVGTCGDPTRDGVVGAHPHLEHADIDLDNDGTPEVVVTDRSRCTPEGNCYWNVFTSRHNDCVRYVGTFVGATLEALAARGDDNMVDVRSYYNLHGGRMLLQGYHYMRGGYEQTEALVCRRESDDKLACADQ